MGIPFTLPMGFLFTVTMGILLTIALAIQLTISNGLGSNNIVRVGGQPTPEAVSPSFYYISKTA